VSSPSSLRQRSLLLAFACAASGCILFVSPSGGGSECKFSGASTDCGLCIAASCQTQVNGCCGDPSCSGAVMPLVDGCASKQDASCGKLKSATGGEAAESLGACVSRSCKGVCAPFSGTSETTCEEGTLGEGHVCTCKDLGTPGSTNTFVCSPEVYPGTLCCAPPDWPQPGQECDCFVSGCPSDGVGCLCNLVDYVESDVSPTCSGAVCCAGAEPDEPYGCGCSPSPCTRGLTEVPTCGIAELQCASGQVQVAACSKSR
jgi:hypothetical protein